MYMVAGKEGKVRKNDFEQYYNQASFGIPSDRDFAGLLKIYEAKHSTQAPAPESPSNYAKIKRAQPTYNPVTGAMENYENYSHNKGGPWDKASASRKGELIRHMRDDLIVKGTRGIFGLYRSFRVYFLKLQMADTKGTEWNLQSIFQGQNQYRLTTTTAHYQINHNTPCLMTLLPLLYLRRIGNHHICRE